VSSHEMTSGHPQSQTTYHAPVMSRRIVVVHNNIDRQSAIGKLAMWATQVALEADYSVIAVAKDLHPSLKGEVRHLPLHVPHAVFAYQWARALSTVKSALTSVSYDLLHTFQPQLTSIADTWHVQFLTRAAEEADSFPRGGDALSRWRRSQLRAVATMEDRYLRRLSDNVNVLFPSQFMLGEFSRLYGRPRYQVLPNPAPAASLLSVEERKRHREELVGSFGGVVVGYLGGLEDRKGWRELVDGIALATDAFLIFGGSGSERFRDERLGNRCRTVGYVEDPMKFLAACDVLAVPSSFDPCPLVVTEAAASGVPSITTPMVGGQDEVLKYGAGVSWDRRAETLPAIVRSVAQDHAALVSGTERLAEALSIARVSERLRQIWLDAMDRRLGGQPWASA
jgi:glycosyltransferase involved in cell wall biosynthesis